MIIFQTYTPSPPLSTYVEYLWRREVSAQPHQLERMVPLGRSGLTIDLGGDGLRVSDPHSPDPSRIYTFRESVFCSAHAKWFLLDAGRNVARMGVYFKPGGAYPFFGQAVGELHGADVPLEALWGLSAANELRERLYAERTPEARFQTLERLLLARLTYNTQNPRHNGARHPAVAVALDALRASSRPGTIARLVDQSGLSHRHFIAVFRREVGMSPKRFCRLRRFLDAAHYAWETDRVDQINWAEVALAYGYYDQSHLVNDFGEFAGVSPTAYIRLRDPGTFHRLPFARTEGGALQVPA